MNRPRMGTLAALAMAAAPMLALADEAAQSDTSPLLDEGSLLVDARLRYEFANQFGPEPSHAFTLRTRFGYETGTRYGLSALLEFSHLSAMGSLDRYNAAGTNSGGADHTVIADVPGTEINRAALAYEHELVSGTLGRQRLVLDSARFVGNVGWRQREQTFDAAAMTLTPIDDLRVFYSYLLGVNRVLGPRHSQGRFDSSSHLLNASYGVPRVGQITGYAYLLRFGDAPAASSNTFGLSFSGDYEPATSVALGAHLEYAHQRDNDRSPVDSEFSNTYLHGRGSASYRGTTLSAGWERLGSDGGARGFATPLATLHAFNGWADAFLVTPDAGLRDGYLAIEQRLPYQLRIGIQGHDFRADTGGERYGYEIDAVLAKTWARGFKTLAKLARFEGRSDIPDITRFWLQVEFSLPRGP